MRKRAGVIIFCKSQDKVLLIKRVKQDVKYWVVPGGGLAIDESFENAARREISEEIGYFVKELLEGITISKEDSVEKYYVALVDHTYHFNILGEEAKRNNELNQYILEWVTVDELEKINLLPAQLKNVILEILPR